MKRARNVPAFSIFLIVVALALPVSISNAGQIWTDANGDGLPESGENVLPRCSIATIDVWIDSEAFPFTRFVIWAEWATGLNYVEGSGVVLTSACGPDSIDRSTSPVGIGFSGVACNVDGIHRIGSFQLQTDDLLTERCVYPLIDPSHPLGTFSILWYEGFYNLFQVAHGSCGNFICDFGPCPCTPTGTGSKSWGQVKGLYR